MNIDRVSILNVLVSALNMQLALSQLHTWLLDRATHHYVCVTPAHSLMECVNNPALLPVFNGADMITPDGMAVVWLLKFKGHKEVERVYGPDLLLAACAYGIQHGWQHYFYGGAPDVAQSLAESLQSKFPGLQIAGTCSPPFGDINPKEQDVLIEQVNASTADIVWVGMSSPRQERWMHTHLGQVHAPIMIGVGAAFDFLSGRKAQAPKWIQKIGMEWLFRLANEPKRLWPRYRQYPKFAWLALHELLLGYSSKK